MKEKLTVMRDSDEAAHLETVTGWVSRQGQFFGNDERTARWAGCTHEVCDGCGQVIERGLEEAWLDADAKTAAVPAHFKAEALPTLGPKISSTDFENEIDRLTAAINALNTEQESLRLSALKENELLSVVKREIAAAERTLAEYKQDAQFLDRRGIDDLVCPVCGAEHAESFLGTLQYVEDARSLESTILHLKANESRLLAQVNESTNARRQLETQYNELDQILRIKKGRQ